MQLQEMPHDKSAGALLRAWRCRRRLTQLELSLDAAISTRHLSFVETGRSQPSREMIVRLAKQLQIPLRERNAILAAAGFAAVYPERSLEEPALERVRHVVDRVLAGHEPYPALAVDRHWNLLAANAALQPLLEGVAPLLLEAPVNVLRLSLHPDGLAPRIVNLSEWRAHLLERLQQQVDTTADPALAALWEELAGYPCPNAAPLDPAAPDYAGLAIPLRLASPGGVLSFMSTTTVFGTPTDVLSSELAIECFFPADDATADALRPAGGSCSAAATPLLLQERPLGLVAGAIDRGVERRLQSP